MQWNYIFFNCEKKENTGYKYIQGSIAYKIKKYIFPENI
jgi:hypothetical protein